MSWDDEDDDWENAVADTPKEMGTTWAGEDEEEGDVADGWDDEDKEEEDDGVPQPARAQVAPGEKRLTKRQIAKKRDDDERRKREAREKILSMSEEDKAKMKELERRRIEKEDLKLSSDMFGDMGDMSIALDDIETGGSGSANADNGDMAVDGEIEKFADKKPKGVNEVSLKSTDDYKKFAESLGSKVTTSVKPTLRGDTAKLVEFLKSLLTTACAPITLDDTNDLKKHFNTVYNNKAKDPSKKKKPLKKKAGGVVKLSGGGATANYGDDYNDYDF